jgi:hypothetical protein
MSCKEKGARSVGGDELDVVVEWHIKRGIKEGKRDKL